MTPQELAETLRRFRPPWHKHAVCHDQGETMFGADIDAAKQLCRGCPVVADCLAWALLNDPEDGVWGGMTQDERRAAVRRYKKCV